LVYVDKPWVVPAAFEAVTAAAKLAAVGVTRNVPTFEPRFDRPATGSPVAFVNVPDDGVPSAPPERSAPEGKSPVTKVRHDGEPLPPPEGEANTQFPVWAITVASTVPVVVTAVLGVELSKTPSPVNVTLVTVPPPPPAVIVTVDPDALQLIPVEQLIFT
jgi:hypothetical protein